MVCHVPLNSERLAEFCRRRHVRELALFGSVLRDDFGPDSDVDVMIAFEPGFTCGIDDWLAMTDELEALFGRKVDLHSRQSIDEMRNPFRRRSILSSAQVVHAA